MVSDHSENLVLAPMIVEANPDPLATEYGKKLSDLVKAGKGYEAFLTWRLEGLARHRDIINSPEMFRTIQDRAYTSPIWYTPGQ